MALYQSKGVLRYYNTKLILEADQGIVEYYRAMLPRSFRTNRQLYPAHISVVRKETPEMGSWRLYEGEEVEFSYDNEIKFGEVYVWLNAFSTRLEEIRRELKLPVEPWGDLVPPAGFNKFFHITLGNFKANA